MGKRINELGVEDLVAAGLALDEAIDFETQLKKILVVTNKNGGIQVWRQITATKLLKPWHPHPLHQLLYYSVYRDHDESINGPPIYWFPSL